MRITDVDAVSATYVFPEEDRWWTGKWEHEVRAVQFNCAIVRVHTDAGITGLGDMRASFGRDRNIRALEEIVKPRLIGRNPFDVEKLTVFGADQPASFALAAVDVACWDIIGKATGTPLYRLLDTAGCAQTRLRAYASAGVAYEWWGRPETLLDELRRHQHAGFTAMKLRIGTSWGVSGVTVPRFLDLLNKLRAASGDGFELMLDANGRFDDYGMALEVARELRRLDFRWFEDPMPPAEPELYRRLREESGMVISGGEWIRDPGQLRAMLDGGAYEIIHIDCNWLGITQARRWARWASERGVLCIPHNWTTAVAAAANAHFVAALPNRYTLEYQMIDNRLMTDIVDAPLLPVDGYVTVPEKPGLGIELDLEALAAYPAQAGDAYRRWPADDTADGDRLPDSMSGDGSAGGR